MNVVYLLRRFNPPYHHCYIWLIPYLGCQFFLYLSLFLSFSICSLTATLLLARICSVLYFINPNATLFQFQAYFIQLQYHIAWPRLFGLCILFMSTLFFSSIFCAFFMILGQKCLFSHISFVRLDLSFNGANGLEH